MFYAQSTSAVISGRPERIGLESLPGGKKGQTLCRPRTVDGRPSALRRENRSSSGCKKGWTIFLAYRGLYPLSSVERNIDLLSYGHEAS